MMSALEEIKARAEEPTKVLEWGTAYSDEYASALQASQADVPPLIAALESVEEGFAGLEVWAAEDAQASRTIKLITATLRKSIGEALAAPTKACASWYTDTNDYVTYHCILRPEHGGPHEDTLGPGMRWYA